MTLDELETFVRIAQTGSFREASLALGRSQPAISRRVQQLEETVGGDLLERRPREVVLSPLGEVLLPYAEAALAAARDGARATRAHLAGGQETVRIAVVGTLANTPLVDALREFGERAEGAHVDLRTATSREVSGLVRSGEAHLGLRYFPEAHPALASSALAEDRLCVVLPGAHPHKARSLRQPASLREETWICFPPARDQPESFGHLADKLLAEWSLHGSQRIHVDSLTAQKRLIEAGLGVGLMPPSAVREEVALGSLRTVALPGRSARLPIVAVWRAAGHPSQGARDLLRILRKHLK